MSIKHYVPFLCFALLAGACTDPSGNNNGDEEMGMTTRPDPTPECLANEEFNDALGKCVAAFPDLGSPDMSSDMSGADMPGGDDMGDEPDMRDPECVDITVYLDKDGDGRGLDDESTNITACLGPNEVKDGYARRAGDCDDDNRARSPDAVELCDEVDNDCNDLVNDGIECVFYAHGPEGNQSPRESQGRFYTVDPFAKTVTYIDEIYTDGSLLDIDTHPDGKLYGISSSSLYRYDFVAGQWVWTEVGPLQADLQGANGLAIDRSGDAYATARNELFSVDLATGRAAKLGTLTGNVESSGDCVVNKGDTLFMTSKKSDPNLPDDLVKINRGSNTTEIIGTTSHSRIFGLTAAWGKLFGLTSNGELIEIDQANGQSTLIKKFDDVSFYGAASTPGR